MGSCLDITGELLDISLPALFKINSKSSSRGNFLWLVSEREWDRMNIYTEIKGKKKKEIELVEGRNVVTHSVFLIKSEQEHGQLSSELKERQGRR